MCSERAALNMHMMNLNKNIIKFSFENGEKSTHCFKKGCIPVKFSLLHFVVYKIKTHKCSVKYIKVE